LNLLSLLQPSTFQTAQESNTLEEITASSGVFLSSDLGPYSLSTNFESPSNVEVAPQFQTLSSFSQIIPNNILNVSNYILCLLNWYKLFIFSIYVSFFESFLLCY